MPAPASTDEFLQLVRKSGVVNDDRLGAYLADLRAAGPLPSEPAKVAGSLIRDGLLTIFQAEQILQGKWRRFTIGKYKVLERLGFGRVGSVYLCEHALMRLRRLVAIKVLPTSLANDPWFVERLYREARALAALHHPNVVRAYDIDQDDTLHFLVMEYVDGSSLKGITKKCGPMAVLRAAHYVRQAALGLQHVHEKGMIHRDVKPADILVDRSGCVKLIDFGAVRFFQDEDNFAGKSRGHIVGTPDYMAPEQAVDPCAVDIRADIYSLGAAFYVCLTRQKPFPGGTAAEKLARHQTQQPEPIRQLRPEVPEGLAALIERMMAKDPAQRPQTPQEVADALAPYTAEPIGPPPEDEMPRLCPAARGDRPGP
jgi:serine/threonine protein kinase